MTTIRLILDAGSTPAVSTISQGVYKMFNWIFKKDKKQKVDSVIKERLEDTIEEALWEIKEQFDLETEEVERTVLDKRENVEYMRKSLKREL